MSGMKRNTRKEMELKQHRVPPLPPEIILCSDSRDASGRFLLLLFFADETEGQEAVKHIVRNLPIECGRIKEAVRDIITEIEPPRAFQRRRG